MNRIQKLMRQITLPTVIENPVDLLYLTGMNLSKGRLLVLPQETFLIVDGRYFEIAKKQAPCTTILWEEQHPLLEKHKKIAFDSAFLTYEEYVRLQKKYPSVEWVPQANIVKDLKLIKDAQEIGALKEAASVTWQGYKHILTLLKEGVSEEEIALEFEIFCRRKGASGLSFESIIAFGENSAFPHHRAGKARLKMDQIVLIDVGAIVKNYHADMTRVFFFGKANPQLLALEAHVRRAQTQAIEAVRPGVKLGHLDQIVQDAFEKAHVKPLYIHSLGHGLGLETHEYPRIKYDGDDKELLLQKGMVFTIEPGLYQAGLGGIRIEDMILVTENGYEKLLPRE